MNKLILSEPVTGIVEIKFNRPLKHNAVNVEMMDELKVSLSSLRERMDLKGLVLTGEGEKAFCSGGDIEAFENLITKEEAYEMLSKMGDILYELLTFPLPTFAYLNGVALGGGCEIATACDFRIAQEGISLGFIQGKLAITTGWGGATMLHEKLPYGKAMSLLLSAKRLSAEEAETYGFIDKIVPATNGYTETYHFIRNFLVEHPSVLRAYKSVKVNQWTQMQLHVRIMSEIKRCAELWEMEEHHKAVSLFINRKK
ncbi:enoyl-CoA hydratase [Bacillus sp. SA1-12]|uniref:enoyl-CoA hydratase/isomerase family protein n=1 Tax=Bacillus sp. SA1-12 TaxID=1455638 RepID=UPI0006265901|nr:enoyl-CoA hydratase/isomerase family protein [Bacillus sp. SA1-12]KKI93751.1 enoyl-CoA hydratase [Bacillus sp. SA1-12]